MAGQVTPRKLFSGMVPDLKLIALMASLRERNAESIFGAISAEIEKTGAHHENCPVNDYVTDRELKIITTPAYMYDTHPVSYTHLTLPTKA